MAKASAVEMKHAASVENIEGSIEKLEKAFKRLERKLEAGPLATLETVEAIEGEPMWGFTDEEMHGLMMTVEQLCNRAGVPWETLDLANDQVDPITHIQQRLALVGDRFGPVEHQGANTPPVGDQLRPPVEAGTKHDDAPTAAPDTSGPKNKGK